MLERLTFEMEEYPLKVELAVKERQLYYRVTGGEKNAAVDMQILDGGRRWLRHLEKLHLESWRASYQPETPPEEHHLWRLAFKDSKIGMRRIVGDQAFPGSWAAFVDLMNQIPGVEIHKVRQIEQVSIILHDTMENLGGNIYLPKQKKIPLVEKLIINRGKHLLIFTRHKQGIGTERHAFDSARNVPLLLERIALQAARFTAQPDTIADDYLPQAEWKIIWHDGSEDSGSYTLRGREMPEAWKEFIQEIEQFTGNVRGKLF